MSIYVFLKLIGSLAFFMYGMRTMSESLQKIMGDNLRHLLGSMTKNHFTGLLIGIFITACVQSSTATTVMTVSFVNAGLFSLAQAISVIMGANIGTTITSWLIAFVGFKWNTTLIMLPLFGLALPFIFSRKSNYKYIGELILGFSLMFIGLAAVKSTLTDSEAGCIQELSKFVNSLHHLGLGSLFLFILFGAIVTLLVQSSVLIQVITLTLCSLGIIDIYLGTALVIGENIGSAITPFVASLSGNAPARRAGLAHLIFNLFGAILFITFLHPIVNGVSHIVTSIMNDTPNSVTVTFTLASLHTLFNVLPTLILIWFVKGFEKLVCFFIPIGEDEEEFRLRFISGGMLSTGELSILQARKEIALYSKRAHKMFSLVQRLLHTEDDNDFNKLYSRIEKYENIMDNIEVEIANYLNSVAEGHLSSESKLRIRAMLREITEIESIGDSCYHLARTLSHKRDVGIEFNTILNERLREMMTLNDRALTQMEVIVERSDYHSPDMAKSYNLEKEINSKRIELKDLNLEDVNNKKYGYQTGVFYMDMITECEKLGDYIVNVVEASGDSKNETR